MKFAAILQFVACLLVLAVFRASEAAPAKQYMFVQAKCTDYPNAKEIGGPLSLCTFPPKHADIPQEDIDAVIKHIKTLNLPN